MRNPVVRAGLLYGALGALWAMAVPIGLDDYRLFAGAAGNVQVIAFFVGLAFSLLAGRAASAQTGLIGSGALAGLLVGLITGLVGEGFSLIVYSPVGRVPYDTLIQALAVMASLVVIILDVGLGAGAGALGGLLGRWAHQRGAA